ncbi:hypothetical protein ADUPG1_004841, partial [Aduncisulcus paluster]
RAATAAVAALLADIASGAVATLLFPVPFPPREELEEDREELEEDREELEGDREELEEDREEELPAPVEEVRETLTAICLFFVPVAAATVLSA